MIEKMNSPRFIVRCMHLSIRVHDRVSIDDRWQTGVPSIDFSSNRSTPSEDVKKSLANPVRCTLEPLSVSKRFSYLGRVSLLSIRCSRSTRDRSYRYGAGIRFSSTPCRIHARPYVIQCNVPHEEYVNKRPDERRGLSQPSEVPGDSEPTKDPSRAGDRAQRA